MRASSEISVCVIVFASLGATGCTYAGGDSDLVAFKVAVGSQAWLSNRSGRSAGLAGCSTPKIQIRSAGEVRGEDLGFSQTFESPAFNWLSYFGVGSDDGALLSAEEMTLSLRSGVTWSLNGYGSAVLRGSEAGTESYSPSFNLKSGEVVFKNEGEHRLFAIGATPTEANLTSWECGSLSTWDRDNILDPMKSGATLGENPQVVVPLTSGSPVEVTPVKGASERAELTLTAARVPFGAYSGNALSVAEFMQSTSKIGAEVLIEEALNPFVNATLVGLESRMVLSGVQFIYVQVIPVLRDLATDDLWRGVSTDGLADFAAVGEPAGRQYPMHIYPIPPRQSFRLGIFLKCAPSASGETCGEVTFDSGDLSSGSSGGESQTWQDQRVICLWKDVDYDTLEGIHAREEDLADSGWEIGVDGSSWPSGSVPSTSCDEFFD
jgi:hypothetical protein